MKQQPTLITETVEDATWTRMFSPSNYSTMTTNTIYEPKNSAKIIAKNMKNNGDSFLLRKKKLSTPSN